MKLNFVKHSKYLALLVCMGFGQWITQGQESSKRNYLMEESFTGVKSQSIKLYDSATLTADPSLGGKDLAGNGWLRLTNDKAYTTGGVIIGEAFSSSNGVVLEFEYKTWRSNIGNEGRPLKADITEDLLRSLVDITNKEESIKKLESLYVAPRGGDGFSVFLIDGKIQDNEVRLGAKGQGLGYGTGGENRKGITGGYLGLGFDEYGNFTYKGVGGTEKQAADEYRKINPEHVWDIMPDGDLKSPSTLLHYVKTNYLSDNTIKNINTGSWIERFRYANRNSIALRGKVLDDESETARLIAYKTDHNESNTIGYLPMVESRPSDELYYRKVQVQLYQYGTGYRVEVLWMKTVNGEFEELFTADYAEKPYDTFKLGFSSGTGDAVNFHEIRNVSVFVPEGVRVQKTADREVLGVGQDLTYTINVTNLSQAGSYSNIILQDDLEALSAFFEVESISYKYINSTKGGEGVEDSSVVTNFDGQSKKLKGIRIDKLQGRDQVIFTIKGKVKKVPEGEGVLENTARIDLSSTTVSVTAGDTPAKISTEVIEKSTVSSTTKTLIEDPRIGLKKEGAYIPPVKEGAIDDYGTIVYTFSVKNIGNVDVNIFDFKDELLDAKKPLTAIIKGDKEDKEGKPIQADGVLAPGEEWFLSLEQPYVVTKEDYEKGEVKNTASIKAITAQGTIYEDLSGDKYVDEEGNRYDKPTVTIIPKEEEESSLLITNPHIYQTIEY